MSLVGWNQQHKSLLCALLVSDGGVVACYASWDLRWVIYFCVWFCDPCQETLRKAEEIFGSDNKDLYLSFQGLLNRNLHWYLQHFLWSPYCKPYLVFRLKFFSKYPTICISVNHFLIQYLNVLLLWLAIIPLQYIELAKIWVRVNSGSDKLDIWTITP